MHWQFDSRHDYFASSVLPRVYRPRRRYARSNPTPLDQYRRTKTLFERGTDPRRYHRLNGYPKRRSIQMRNTKGINVAGDVLVNETSGGVNLNDLWLKLRKP